MTGRVGIKRIGELVPQVATDILRLPEGRLRMGSGGVLLRENVHGDWYQAKLLDLSRLDAACFEHEQGNPTPLREYLSSKLVSKLRGGKS